MKFQSALVCCILITLIGSIWAVTPQTKTIDDGNLTLFVLNTGSFGFDPDQTRNGFAGLYYPAESFRGIMAGAGIWVAGIRDSVWYLSISADESEFVPGPIGSGLVPLDTLFGIYKVTRGEDYLLNDDYRNWPISSGAPTDAFGQPLIRGSQSLYTVFNDADSAAHTFTGFSGPGPLGIEVKQTVHAWDNDYQWYDTLLTQIIFFDYVVINRSEEPIESCIVSIYVDPDIGFPRSDRVGSIAEYGAAYVYNENNIDPEYGASPPVVGMMFLNNRAASMNYYYSCSIVFPECVRIDTLPEVLNLIRGLRPNGQPYFDPNTSLITNFPYNGDPVDSTGWVADLSRDYRFLLNTRATDLEAGDSILLQTALIVAQGDNYLDGVAKFSEAVQMLNTLTNSQDLTPTISILPAEPLTVTGRRIRGHDWGGRFLGGGVDLANYLLGYATSENDLPKSTLSIGKSSGQALHRFKRSGDWVVYDGKTGTNTGITLRDGIQEFECIVLDTDSDGSIVDEIGRLEPLILTNVELGAFPLDALGASLTSLRSRLTYAIQLDDDVTSLGPVEIYLDGETMQSDYVSIPDTIVISEPASEAPRELSIYITNPSNFLQTLNIYSPSPANLGASPATFELGPGESRYVSMFSSLAFESDSASELSVQSYSFRDSESRVAIRVLPIDVTVAGDANNDTVVNLADLLYMVKILYRDFPIVTTLRQIDSNCDKRFNLVDLVTFVNYIYGIADLPCDPLQK